MTYFQIMYQALQYCIKESLDKDVFSYWGIFIENEKDINSIKTTATKQQIYLFLRELKNYIPLNNIYSNLFAFLNEDLSTIHIDKTKTIEKALKVTRQALNEDSFYMDAKRILGDEEIYNDYSKSSLEQLQEYKDNVEVEKAKEYILQGNLEKQVQFTAEENMIYDIVTILPELFFKENGYTYIPSSYKIEDEYIRSKCYEYVKANINAFIWEKNLTRDYRSIIYAMDLISIVIGFVQKNKYKELDHLIEIDTYLEEMNGNFISLVSILYDDSEEENIEIYENAFHDIEQKQELFFLLDYENDELKSEYIAATLLYCFNKNEINQKQIKEHLNDLFHWDLSHEKKIKQKGRIDLNK